MCRSGNQTICRQTRDYIWLISGHRHMSNREMRAVMERIGGCVVKGVDKGGAVVLLST